MKYLLFIFIFYGLSSLAMTDFQFFESGIDYWKEKKVEKKAAVQDHAEKEKPQFEWEKYLDPKNNEFFKEGDYVPPEPFMELVRNPSDENIKNWFFLIETKNKLSDELYKRINEYVAKNKEKITPASEKILYDNLKKIPKTDSDIKQFRFRFYFNSSCPHCIKMFSTVSSLRTLGYYVEAFQVDSKNASPKNLTFPVIKSTEADLKNHKVESVPLLLVGDMNKKLVYRLSGYQSLSGVLKSIKEIEVGE